MKKTLSIFALLALCGIGTTLASSNYTLRQGDQLLINVAQDPELGNSQGNTVPFTIRPDGNVSFPMVGSIPAQGMTVEEFTQFLTDNLSKYIVNPNISVNVMQLGGVRVYVFGEINRPGAYTLTKSNRVFDALGAANGFNWDTAKKKVWLIHQDQPEKPIAINLNHMLKTGDMTQNYELREGDILYFTKKSRIVFARDIAPLLTGAYAASHIGRNND